MLHAWWWIYHLGKFLNICQQFWYSFSFSRVKSRQKVSRLISNIQHIPLEAEKPLMIYPTIYANKLIVGIINIQVEFHHFRKNKMEFYLFIKKGSPVGVLPKKQCYWQNLFILAEVTAVAENSLSFNHMGTDGHLWRISIKMLQFHFSKVSISIF